VRNSSIIHDGEGVRLPISIFYNFFSEFCNGFCEAKRRKRIFSKGLCEAKKFLERKCFIYSKSILLEVIEMAEVMIKIPERVKQEFPEVEWSKVAERAVLEEFRKLASIKLFDELFKHSELTNEDCLKLGKEVNKAVRLRIEKELSKSG